MKRKKKVMVFGTFDIIHAGHENLFQQARQAVGENHEPHLVVSVARDVNVRRIKGFFPRHSESKRASRLKQHPLVNQVVLGGVDNHITHIVKLQPDIIALGYDQKAYVGGLKKELSKKGVYPSIVRLRPYQKHRYKTAKIAPSGKPIKMAIFDIDGTIFRSSLVLELMSVLVDRKVFKASTLKDIQSSYKAWLNRHGTYETFIMNLVRVYQKNIIGCSAKQVESAIEYLLEQQKGHVYRYTRNLIERCKKQNYFLFAVSGSPLDIVEPFANSLGFHGSCGREYEVKNGKYTGKVTNDVEMNLNKDKLVKKYLHEHGLSADFKSSIAIGDTETEIPLLRLVGQPIAFNPNMQLAKYAKKRQWSIVVERKDVMYELESYKFSNIL